MAYEMMFDLETLDVKSSAAVLSYGAVVWEQHVSPTQGISWHIVDKIQRVIRLDSQLARNRTVGESTLLWWMQQNRTAQDEAFSSNRLPVMDCMHDLCAFATKWDTNAYWASPATFDFPIWESLAAEFHSAVPWTYRQKYDVRTVVREVGYSVDSHVYKVGRGTAHTPVFDCEMQIDLLTAARVKLGRKMTEKNP